MAQKEGHKQVAVSAPYVSYKTFKNFLDSLKVAIPGRIDRSVLHTMSGGNRKHLMHALRTMGLVTEREIPTESLKRLASSTGPDEQKALTAALKVGYPFLFDGSIDLSTASGKQLLDEFAKTGLNGDSVRKSVGFFLAAGKDAGIKLSTFFDKIQSRSAVAKKTNGSASSAKNAPPQRKNGNARDTSEITKPARRESTPAPSEGDSVSVRLKNGETLTLSLSVRLLALTLADRKFVLDIIDRMESRGDHKTDERSSKRAS